MLVDKPTTCAWADGAAVRTVDPMSTIPPPFEVVWELDPPATPDLDRLHRQLDSARQVAAAVLVPDNHTGRATVSSLSVARTVQAAGLAATACLNARDRNLLGLRRDLLTCAADGIDEVLLVYGDEPEVGERASNLTVRTMVDECRTQTPGLRVGVTSRLGPLPAWKQTADRLFVQVSYDLDALLRWREGLRFDGPVHPAVLVVPSVAMAQRLSARVPELRVPDTWLAAIARDPAAGVELAADLVARIRDSGAFAGVHVVAGARHRSTAQALRRRAAVPVPVSV